ncbi:maltose alpha-D-glucosyltransferase [Candidatus Manganitrophus noduliformans]|uniref:Maltokinase n=1 Tax=Candidatus Manganitrophus noduliformans TaxID=2606439 RepID=A0A7X6DPU3_9BACT|nr:maltose alpha-D-glucosyltransferase [Candidatus Manganitrophus noduliformans]NKE71173.1 maltose alpha-D-glucosyltransferase [Candidatus Manganitrophus noduliformans]
MSEKEIRSEHNPLWYKDAVIYQLHIKAFFDSNNDGVGDFKGLTQKLDYLKDLGITAIWVLPFYPSPLKDDGYDIADYFNIHPDYGTLRDFKEFLKEAHRRGMRVITELVLNHTSDQHPWFQRARRAKPGSVWRDFYVWSDTPEKYKDARIIFKDFEASNWTWDPVAKAYYWHRFYSHQPDLNFDNPHVRKEMFRVMEHWLEMGVDGLRLDAVPYLYEREGTNCENLPETYEFLRQLRTRVDLKFKNKMLLAEANQWPEDAVAYFGKGDACHMAFHFPLMPRMFMALRMEDRFPIIDILEQTPSPPENGQWAIFLRNHDELTLEMVTDEERDYMYRIYARDPKMRINLGIRRRLGPLLENDRRKIELMNVLLFSLPGTPVIYYGDEIGMGDNFYLGDRNGVRTPMQWNGDRNTGFSQANPQKLFLPAIIDPEYHYESVNVENQERNHSSLLWSMKRFVATRKYYKAFGRGTIEFLLPDNPKVLAFLRHYKDEEHILVVVNLSRHSQIAELDLSQYVGHVPETLFSRNRFPEIRDGRYTITLGPYGYYRFILQKKEESMHPSGKRIIPEISVEGDWRNVLKGRQKQTLERNTFPAYIVGCRWYGGKARQIEQLHILEAIPIGKEGSTGQLLLLQIDYTEGMPETYLLPIAFASGEGAARIAEEAPHSVIARVIGEQEGILYDGIYDEALRDCLLSIISKRQRIKGARGEIIASPGKRFKSLAAAAGALLASQVLKGEQTNSNLLYGQTFLFKLYRRLDEGINPDLEIGRFLTENALLSRIPPYAGAIEYRRPGAEPMIVGLLQGFVPNEGDAWRYTVDAVERYFERVLSKRGEIDAIPKAPPSLLETAFQEVPPLLHELIGSIYLEMATLLGKRTAEFHLALSSPTEDSQFAPEPYTLLYQRSVYQGMQSHGRQVFQLLRQKLKGLPEPVRTGAQEVLNSEREILERFKTVYRKKISTMKIRIHGDYHLGQVLYTGNDFYIIDFEGEPARPLSERRLKRSPFRDVAGMIRSFHYKAYSGLVTQASIRPEDVPVLEPWADLWYRYTSAAFLRSYLDTAGDAPFIPKEREDIEVLLNTFLLDKAVYEIGYELNNRPEWIMIPLKGITHLMEAR